MGLSQPNTSGILPESLSLPHGPWGTLFYYFSSPEQFKNNILIWFIMRGPGKTVNEVSWAEEDNVFQVPWLICSALVQTSLCNLWALPWGSQRLLCLAGSTEEREGQESPSWRHAMLFPHHNRLNSRERRRCVWVQSAVWTACMGAHRCHPNAQLGLAFFGGRWAGCLYFVTTERYVVLLLRSP